MTLRAITCSALFLLVAFVTGACGWYENTHRVFNRIAVTHGIAGTFSLDQYLKDQLRMKDGLKETVDGRQVTACLEDGGAAEDLYPRYRNHFHDPLKPWNDAGLKLRFLGFIPWDGISSILWALIETGQYSQGFSWYDARYYYLKSLTAPSQKERGENSGRLFQ